MSSSTRNRPEPAATTFFIGYAADATAVAGSRLRMPLVMLAALTLLGAAGFAAWQSTPRGGAWFDFGDVREYRGVLVAEQTPMLIRNPETLQDGAGPSVLLLVGEWKFGLDPELAERLHLQPVTLRGTRIHDDQGQAMIEVAAGSIEPESTAELFEIPDVQQGSEVTLHGEIVDSKCYLGVMNPGVLKPHRACAIHCIRGGIPPLLLVRGDEGTPPRQYVLVGKDGESVGERILDRVALPVEVTGKLETRGELSFLRIDPATIRRL